MLHWSFRKVAWEYIKMMLEQIIVSAILAIASSLFVSLISLIFHGTEWDSVKVIHGFWMMFKRFFLFLLIFYVRRIYKLETHKIYKDLYMCGITKDYDSYLIFVNQAIKNKISLTYQSEGALRSLYKKANDAPHNVWERDIVF